MTDYLYIPLWYDSNWVWPIVSFTFHSGTILIYSEIDCEELKENFAFHSGTILIPMPTTRFNYYIFFTFHSGTILMATFWTYAKEQRQLYIPLWYDPNMCLQIIK